MSNTWIRRSLGLGLFIAVPAVEAAGAFTPGVMPALANEGSITAMAAGDLDGDGRSDLYLVYGNRGGGVGGTETALADVLLRGVPGGYEPAAAGFDAAAPVAGSGVVLADFDRDGDRDVLVAGGGTYDGATMSTLPAPTQLFRNLGGGQFAAPTPIGPEQRSTGIAAGDIDGDGDLDVALARFNGRVDVYRNDSAVGGGIVFTLQLQLVAASGPAPELGAVAFGDISGDGRADLLVLRVLDSGSAANPEPRGVVSFIGNAANGFGPATVVPMPEGVPTGLAVADFDLDGRADVAVSAAIGSAFLGPVTAASRVLRGTPGGLVVSPVRFPAHAHTAVAAGDLNADGRPDLVFGRRRCTPTALGCLNQALSSLVFYFGTPGGFNAGPQCLGRHADAATRLLVAELDADALADVAFAGQRPVQGDGDGLGWLRNGATGTGNDCCMAELGGDLADGALARGAPAGPGAADIGALARVRDVLMPDSSAGPRLLARYQTFNPEVVALMRSDPTLWRDAATVLAHWARPVRDLVDGRGAQRVVDQDMVDAVDGFLQRLATTGSPALAAAIADERARLPPFGSLVGLTMDEFRAIALPADLILRDGFEAP